MTMPMVTAWSYMVAGTARVGSETRGCCTSRQTAKKGRGRRFRSARRRRRLVVATRSWQVLNRAGDCTYSAGVPPVGRCSTTRGALTSSRMAQAHAQNCQRLRQPRRAGVVTRCRASAQSWSRLAGMARVAGCRKRTSTWILCGSTRCPPCGGATRLASSPGLPRRLLEHTTRRLPSADACSYVAATMARHRLMIAGGWP
mmetsp:Transcript_2432/g.9675  ORF Transcript_2432/g.9675 Transcript_2432/m.9675 type:complete len:200 (-) Transcript_2432:244-843(-)